MELIQVYNKMRNEIQLLNALNDNVKSWIVNHPDPLIRQATTQRELEMAKQIRRLEEQLVLQMHRVHQTLYKN
jgi:hypothetical protein